MLPLAPLYLSARRTQASCSLSPDGLGRGTVRSCQSRPASTLRVGAWRRWGGVLSVTRPGTLPPLGLPGASPHGWHRGRSASLAASSSGASGQHLVSPSQVQGQDLTGHHWSGVRSGSGNVPGHKASACWASRLRKEALLTHITHMPDIQE